MRLFLTAGSEGCASESQAIDLIATCCRGTAYTSLVPHRKYNKDQLDPWDGSHREARQGIRSFGSYAAGVVMLKSLLMASTKMTKEKDGL